MAQTPDGQSGKSTGDDDTQRMHTMAYPPTTHTVHPAAAMLCR